MNSIISRSNAVWMHCVDISPAWWGKIRVLARDTLNGLAGRVVARGPPVAHPCLRSTKIAKFQCRKCINVLRLQWMVTNRETSSAIAAFTVFSLFSVLQTLYLCNPNCSSGWTKRDVLATKVDPHFAPATAFETAAYSFSVLVLLAIPISVSG